MSIVVHFVFDALKRKTKETKTILILYLIPFVFNLNLSCILIGLAFLNCFSHITIG